MFGSKKSADAKLRRALQVLFRELREITLRL
jgi:hypothetical protein